MSIIYYEGCAACDQRKWLNDENTDLGAAHPSVIKHTCPLAVTPPKPVEAIAPPAPQAEPAVEEPIARLDKDADNYARFKRPAPIVMVDGIKYVPQEKKIPQEALQLLQDLVKDTVYESPLRAKAGRLQYLLTDTNGQAR